ncbi:hypothetical protein AVEN_54134-1 [Araneus ventricosus]|uniref:Uncharacterized protein n=1 Tax=Araneus ventricosus TaxID=182803 RepID=A0A4Y2BWN2_ARAVE|nr:hypothetical protein AVEN_54134-1 [Araneus ventricosus]
MHDKSYAIIRLPVHLSDMQPMHFYDDDDEECQALERASQRNTMLTAWFELNRIDPDANGYFYADIPKHFVWKNYKWERRVLFDDRIVSRLYSNFKDNLMITDKCCTTLFSDHQAELKIIETNQATALKEAEDSFNQLHDTFIQAISENISGIETSDACGFSWKENIIKDDHDDDPNTTLLSAEDHSNSDRTSVLDVTFTLPEENNNENDTGCIFCINKDETMAAPSSLSVPVAKSSKSIVSKGSKQGKNKKEVKYSDVVEKWCQELFGDDMDDKSSVCDKSDPTV